MLASAGAGAFSPCVLSVIRRQHLLLCAAVLVVACSRQQAPEPPPPKVTVAHPIERELTDWDEYTARLEAVDSVEVRARVSGYLQSVHFSEGSMVKKGDLLFLIDPRPYEAQLRRAEGDLELAKARLDLAQKNLARVASCQEPGHVARRRRRREPPSCGRRKPAWRRRRPRWTPRKLDVEFTRITAPVSGRVSRKLVTEGNLINGGVGHAGHAAHDHRLARPDLRLLRGRRARLPEVRAPGASPAQRPSSRDFKNPVRVGLADEQGFPHEGYMDFVDNQIDRGTGTIQRPRRPAEPRLAAHARPVRAPAPAGQRHVPGCSIPDEAIGSDQSQKFVCVVDDENSVAVPAR